MITTVAFIHFTGLPTDKFVVEAEHCTSINGGKYFVVNPGESDHSAPVSLFLTAEQLVILRDALTAAIEKGLAAV